MIELTNACNLKCLTCSNKDMRRKKEFITDNIFNRALDECKKAQIKRLVLFTVGESFLHKNALIYIQIAKEKGFSVSISTNAMLLDEVSLNKLFKTEIDGIQMSFSGYNKESYEKIYIGGDFGRAIKNLRLIAELCKENGTNVRINGISLNEEHKEKTLQFLENIGFNPLVLKIRTPCNFGGKINLNKEIDNGINSLIIDRKNYVMQTCNILTNRIGIFANGDVTACGCLDVDGEMIIGNILKSGIKQIREGKRYNSILNCFRKGDLSDLKMCSKCDFPYKKKASS